MIDLILASLILILVSGVILAVGVFLLTGLFGKVSFVKKFVGGSLGLFGFSGILLTLLPSCT